MIKRVYMNCRLSWSRPLQFEGESLSVFRRYILLFATLSIQATWMAEEQARRSVEVLHVWSVLVSNVHLSLGIEGRWSNTASQGTRFGSSMIIHHCFTQTTPVEKLTLICSWNRPKRISRSGPTGITALQLILQCAPEKFCSWKDDENDWWTATKRLPAPNFPIHPE